MSPLTPSSPVTDSEQASTEELVEQGRITGSYGVQGWVKVEPFNTGSSLLLQARRWWVRVRPNEPPQPWQIVRARPQGSFVVAQVEHLQQREAAAAFKGARVLVPRSDFPRPEADEYYWVDLIGCRVTGENEHGSPVELGHVVQVSDNGAHGVLHVQAVPDTSPASPPQNARSGSAREHLIPFVAAHVLQVDLEQRLIRSNWPESF